MFNYQAKPNRIKNAKRRLLIAVAVQTLAFCAIAPESVAQLNLGWKDNSSNEDGFCIERSTDGTHFSELTRTPPNTTSFVDNSAEPGTKYYYRVRAYNNYGLSGYSNTSNGLLPLIEEIIETISGALSSIIGSMTKTGDSIYDAGTSTYQISASGLGYETYNDDLRFEYVEASGDVRLVARVHDFNPDGQWARGGIMIRSSLNSNARHASMLINGGSKFETLIRTADGKALVSKSGPTATGMSGYLSIEKSGSSIKLAYSTNGTSWTTLSTTTIDFGTKFLIGLSIGSHYDGKLSGAVIEIVDTTNISFGAAGTPAAPTSAIIGSMTKEGDTVYDAGSGTYLISASGLGYETYNDELRYAYRAATGDFRFAVRVHDFNPDASWARAGIMVRSSLATNARHASMVMNGVKKFETLIRSKDGAALASKSGASFSSGGYLAAQKTGNTVTLSYSTNGASWTTLSTTTIDFGSSFLVGLTIGSQADGNLSGAVMEVVDTQNFEFGGAVGSSSDTTAPAFTDFSTQSSLIGSMNKAGAHTFNAQTGAYQISASGLGYETYSDELRYSYLKKSGDAEFIVRVNDFVPDASWARAGIMIRQSLDPKSKHASMVVNGTGAAESISRASNGGGIVSKSGPAFKKGSLLRLKKTGSTLELSYSANGTDWSLVNKLTISFTDAYYLGFTIGSQSDGKLSSAAFEVVKMQ